MSASRMPTFSPRSRSPSARLTAVVDLPTPPLPEATAMIASDAWNAGRRRRARSWMWTRMWIWVLAPRPRPSHRLLSRLRPLRRLRARSSSAAGALGSQGDQCGRHAGHRADRAFGAVAHAFPLLDGCGIDTDREEHFAVSRHDLGQFSAGRQRRAVGAGDLAECGEDVVFQGGHQLYRYAVSCALDRLPVVGVNRV